VRVSGKYISSTLTPPPRCVRATAVAGNSFHSSLPVKTLARVRFVTSKLPLAAELVKHGADTVVKDLAELLDGAE